MAKTLKSICYTLLPDDTGLSFSVCNATYSVGSTDDPSFSIAKSGKVDIDKSSAKPQLQKLFSDWTTAVKTAEGIK